MDDSGGDVGWQLGGGVGHDGGQLRTDIACQQGLQQLVWVPGNAIGVQ